MKYILFLFCILFLNSFVSADPGTTTDTGIKVNLEGFKKNTFGSPDSAFSNTEDYSLGSSANYGFKTPTYSYGSVSGSIRFGQPTCSFNTPQYCQLYTSCVAAGGYWNALDSNCGRADCHFGTTVDISNPLICKCNNDPYATVQRGNFLQSCPSTCFSKPHQSYSFMKKSCECAEGYTMAANGNCTPNPTVAPQATPVSDCLRELEEKATNCESSANTAVSQCEFAPEDDSLRALHGLLLSGAGTAGENCERAATASTSGYYNTESNRRSCDDGINSCKSTCTDVKKYFTDNKERLYSACRDRAYQAEVAAGPALPPDRFNPQWDSQNRPGLDSQFEALVTRVDNSNTTCTSGTAVKNREKLTASMNEMNTSAKDASTCVCQLNSGSADCASAPGPADCSSNPSAAGCAKVADNCFDAKNTTQKCLCFRNPYSDACTGGKANINIKDPESGVNGFASAKAADTRSGNNSSLNGMATGNNSEAVNTTGLGGSGSGGDYRINASDDLSAATPLDTSATMVGSGGNKAAPSAGGGGSVGGVNPSANSKNSAPVSGSDSTIVKKLGGMFETAKSAIGGVFKKGGGSDSSDGNYRNSEPGFDPRKLRPRGTIVRGVASDEEIAGKHEDIWKVMSKQYKIQDQKDNFIFDAGKK